ncbi:6553_t:CDS:1, partial [Dentiscutata heterogama]
RFSSITGESLNSNLYILNTQNYTWITSTPTDQNPPTPTNSNNPYPTNSDNQSSSVTSSKNLLLTGIGIGVGAIIFITVIIFAGVLLYKRCYKASNAIPTPGNIDPYIYYEK